MVQDGRMHIALNIRFLVLIQMVVLLSMFLSLKVLHGLMTEALSRAPPLFRSLLAMPLIRFLLKMLPAKLF
jgi:hypothetical protein